MFLENLLQYASLQYTNSTITKAVALKTIGEQATTTVRLENRVSGMHALVRVYYTRPGPATTGSNYARGIDYVKRRRARARDFSLSM